MVGTLHFVMCRTAVTCMLYSIVYRVWQYALVQSYSNTAVLLCCTLIDPCALCLWTKYTAVYVIGGTSHEAPPVRTGPPSTGDLTPVSMYSCSARRTGHGGTYLECTAWSGIHCTTGDATSDNQHHRALGLGLGAGSERTAFV